MQTITITGDNLSQKVIEAFKAVALAISPSYEVEYINSGAPRLSKEDAKYLKAMVLKAERGELECVSKEELDISIEATISRARANADNLR